jgi:Zn finger protein HypA/HybF involved in hydrogenase expression
MNTTTLELVEVGERRVTSPDDLDHWFCACNRDVALCGADIAGQPESEPVFTDDDCVVCDDLLDLPCERCGAP